MEIIRAPRSALVKTALSMRAQVMLGLALVLGLALFLRVVALGYDLPNIYHPDEPVYINIIQRIYHGDLNPHFFNYPTLFFYLNALAYLPVFAIAKLFGNPVAVLPSVSLVMGSTLAQTPEAVLVSRGLSVVFGLAAIESLFLLGRSLTGSARIGLLAALLLAISPTAIKINRFITPDTFVVFFVIAAVYFSLRLYRDGRQVDYLLAGICAGLAASSKYNAGLVVLAPLIAHFMRFGGNGLVQVSIYKAMLACGLAFLLTSPFVLLDETQFWQDFTYEAQHYSTGHAGMEGDTLNWYVSYLWRVEGGGTVLGVIGLILGLVRGLPWPAKKSASGTPSVNTSPKNMLSGPFKEAIIVFAFPLIYFVFISRFIVRNDRTLFPVLPFLFLAAAMLLSAILRRARVSRAAQSTGSSASRWKQGGWAAVWLAGMALAVVVPVLTLAQFAPVIGQPVPEVKARAWIEANLPAGTRIAIESYAPYINPARYSITPLFRAIDKDVNWYRSEGIEYIVVAKAMYGRFYCDPGRYAAEKQQYDRLFLTFEEAAGFPNPVAIGPVAALTQRLGDRSICPGQADLIYTHDIKLLKVQ